MAPQPAGPARYLLLRVVLFLMWDSQGTCSLSAFCVLPLCCYRVSFYSRNLVMILPELHPHHFQSKTNKSPLWSRIFSSFLLRNRFYLQLLGPPSWMFTPLPLHTLLVGYERPFVLVVLCRACWPGVGSFPCVPRQ